MSSANFNPWVERFFPAPGRDEIRRRALLQPTALTDLGELPVETACARLNKALKETFYPTTQCVSIIERFLGVAEAHCRTHYRGVVNFYGSIHEDDVREPHCSATMCLTGLAGVGKSELLKALRRLMPPPSIAIMKDGTRFPLESVWAQSVEAAANPNDLLRAFSRSDGTGRKLVQRCRRLSFRNGISLLLADEFQFITLSSEASSQITKMLLALAYLRTPLVYVANFSMLHLLAKRNQQEKDRLLTDVIELKPDAPDSVDWYQTLLLQQAVAPEIFTFDAGQDGAAIHGLCAGLKRTAVKLFELAYRTVHGNKRTVGMDELLRTYKSSGFVTQRTEVEAIRLALVERRRTRRDLWNPLGPNDPFAELHQQFFQEQRQEQADEAAMRAAMNRRERAELFNGAKSAPVAKTRGVTNSKGGRKVQPDAGELMRNALWLRERNKKTR